MWRARKSALKRRIEVQRKQLLDPAESSFFSELQEIVARRRKVLPMSVSRICGVDAAYDGDRIFAAASLFEKSQLIATGSYVGNCSLPYASGLFYLREGPFAVAAVRSLEVRPQLVCFDAHGAAHPRGAGLATVCGTVLGIPSIGIAKSLLFGEVSPDAGGVERIVHDRKTLGFVTRADGAKRYWSPGYSVTIARLASMIPTHASACLAAMAEADRASKRVRSSFRRGGDA
jgi:deoxyribonuclease V